MNLPSIIYVIILINLTVLLAGLCYLIYQRWLAPQSPELARAKSQSGVIIHDALHEANKVLAQAQIEGLKVVAKEKLESKYLEEKFQKALEGLSSDLTKQLSLSVESAEKDYEYFLKTLETTIAKTASANQELITAQTKRFYEDSNKQIQGVLDVELKNAKKVVEEYGKSRMKAVDDNITDILDQVIREVLSLSLSTKDHMQIVFKALEKAKKDNILNGTI
ncbi:MAG: hypothetical protein Q8Q65_03765 [bacterium]|nr:hypothetical protein [bacterium]